MTHVRAVDSLAELSTGPGKVVGLLVLWFLFDFASQNWSRVFFRLFGLAFRFLYVYFTYSCFACVHVYAPLSCIAL